jgi:hypothetical protein
MEHAHLVNILLEKKLFKNSKIKKCLSLEKEINMKTKKEEVMIGYLSGMTLQTIEVKEGEKPIAEYGSYNEIPFHVRELIAFGTYQITDRREEIFL